jgi:hypothetical protein
MSRPVSPCDQNHRTHPAHDRRPCPSAHCLRESGGSSLSEERHGTEIKQLSSSRSQTPISNAVKTYICTTSERMKTAAYKFKTFLQKNEAVRRTYWTAVALGLITTVYYVCSLFFQGRENSIAVRGTAIAEQSKNTTEGIAVAGFIINCQNMRVSEH